jgi:uncharacterized protein
MKNSERYRRSEDLPATLPVFPLRGCVLLPRASVPLNIFEPRYLAMFEAALQSNRLVAIVQPARMSVPTANDNDNDEGDDDSPSESSPDNAAALRTVAGIGRIMAFQELDDGRMIVSLSGISRCRLLDELYDGKPYRTFRIDPEPFGGDLVPGNGENTVPREQLLATLKRFLEARNLKADWNSIGRSGNEQLVNSLSVMSPYGPEEKQALLECATLKARAEMLIALAEMELASKGGGSGSTLQ